MKFKIITSIIFIFSVTMLSTHIQISISPFENPLAFILWSWIWTVCVGILLFLISIPRNGSLKISISFPYLLFSTMLFFVFCIEQYTGIFPNIFLTQESIITIRIIIGYFLAAGLFEKMTSN